ncbi:MAG: homocysteine S-methyltransferase family protein [Deltaproteobacteria bacterium]|nr:homocysteine S-methyltransferase family protein [Deltaproteobacteria bacterium]
MGSLLIRHGIPVTACFEELNEKRPDLIRKIHKDYWNAGAQVIVTNSFGANRLRLKSPEKLERLNRMAVKIARQAAPKASVFASIGPLGREGQKMNRSEMIRIFAEQVRALEREKPDGYLVETMISLKEAVAAARAVRQLSNRYLIVSLTFPKGLEKKRGPAELVGKTLRQAGVDGIGANCGIHPKEVFDFLDFFRKYDPGPWMARPAGGIPTQPVPPEEFAHWASRIAKLGVTYIGGCCGTTPQHIRALGQKIRRVL